MEPRKAGLRLFALLFVLKEQTDDRNSLAAGELREQISKKLSSMTSQEESLPNKRTLYSDIQTLRTVGFDISTGQGTRRKYSLESNFESWELRFLADAARSSHSLTKAQGEKITEKLKSLTTIQSARLLDRRLNIQETYRSGAYRQTAYALDVIEEALTSGCKLSFKYTKLDAKGKEIISRAKGSHCNERIVEPIEYVYSQDGYYYLITPKDNGESGTKTFRVDRMRDVRCLADQSAKIFPASIKKQELEVYQRSFGMFNKIENCTKVTLLSNSQYVKSVIDRFGNNAKILSDASEEAQIEIEVCLSDNFFSWITQFAGGVRISEPINAVDAYQDFLIRNLRPYQKH